MAGSGELSKKEYLKKYLAGNDKKKKKTKISQNPKIVSKIVDDDIDITKLKPVDGDDIELYALAEDAPQIAGIVDDRPEEIRVMSEYRETKKWKIIADDADDGQITVVERGGRKSESDSSPPRKSRNINERQNSSDKSPPRKRSKEEKDHSPPRRKRRESDHSERNIDSDASPPRKIHPNNKKSERKRRNDSDESPPRFRNKNVEAKYTQKRKDFDSFRQREDKHKTSEVQHKRRGQDISPLRKNTDPERYPRHFRNNRDDFDVSPPRKRRARSDSDPSPPRRKESQNVSSSQNKKVLDRRSRQSDSDASPPRQRNVESLASRQRNDRYGNNDQRNRRDTKSPPRGKTFSPKRRNDNADNSPPRKRVDSKSNKNRRSNSESETDLKRKNQKEETGKQKKTLDGKKAGLQNAVELKRETDDFRKRQKETFSKMTDDLSGKNAVTVVRDRKTGKRRDFVEENKKKRIDADKKAEQDAKYAVWGKGLKQVEDRDKRVKEDLYEMSKPLARYADDRDLDSMLKNRDREGDPMLEYVQKKKEKEHGPMKPMYQGSYPPNRYDIRPGYRWDGVDRSSGYEKKWFEEQNARKAREEEAFKWSTEDM